MPKVPLSRTSGAAAKRRVSKSMFSTVDDDTRRELRIARLEMLETDNYAEESASAAAAGDDDDEFYVDDEDTKRKSRSAFTDKGNKAASAAFRKMKEKRSRLPKLAEVIAEETGAAPMVDGLSLHDDRFLTARRAAGAASSSSSSTSSASASARARLAAAEKPAAQYLAARSAPPPHPPRPYCSVCGVRGSYSCVRCGTRYCSAKCGTMHAETKCTIVS